MTEPKPIKLELTLEELKLIDKFVEINDDTLSVLTKIKDAYFNHFSVPQPKMHLKNEGEFSIVSYDTRTYCRLQLPAASFWYIETIDGYGGCALEMIEDIKTKNELESQWLVNDVKYQNDEEPYCPDEPEYYDEIEWDEKDNPKSKTIRSIIDRWWTDTFTTHSKWDAEECMDDLADQIEFFYMRDKK
jgi:hypothetical protein